MIKEEIVSFVRGFLPREDETGRWHYRFLEAVVEKVIVEMYADLYKINPLLVDKYTQAYGVTTPIAITLEASSGIYYSTLPVQIVSLPDKQSGVRHIYATSQMSGRGGNMFVPMDAREADLIFSTDVASVSAKIGYRTRQDTRVDYWNTNAVVRTFGVRMDLLIPFSVYADSDVVLIPELSEKEGGTFIQRVLKELQIVPPAELSDDNAPAKEQSNTKQ
jgi:hypothetical protein